MAVKVVTISRDRSLPKARRGIEYQYEALPDLETKRPIAQSGKRPIAELAVRVKRQPTVVLPKRATRFMSCPFPRCKVIDAIWDKRSRTWRPKNRKARWAIK